MGAINKADLSVAVNGDIRHVTGSTTHTVLEKHQFLMGLLDDQVATGDDFVDVTNEIIPSIRSTDQIITLAAPYNMDDRLAQRFFGGSVTQDGGDEVYSGLRVIGTLNSGTTVPILLQDNKLLPNFWGTGINADAAKSVIMRILVKSRTGGVDIDNKNVKVLNREWGDSWATFTTELGEAEQVASIGSLSDDFNQTAIGTIAGYTDVVNNLEGFQQIDLGNGAGDRDYYSEWDKGTRTLNDLFERSKWIAGRDLAEDSHTGTGKDNAVGNGTITQQAQSFAIGANNKFLTRCRFRIKKTGNPTGNITSVLYAHNGTFGTSSAPTGGALATSDIIVADQIDTAYREVEFVFNGTDIYEMLSASNYYVIAIEYTGDVSNYLEVDGVDTTGHAGNRSDDNGGADATDDLWFEVDASPKIYGMPGIFFNGITHEWDYQTASGNFTQNEELTWGTGATYGAGILLADDDQGTTGTHWIQLTEGIAPTDAMTVTGTSSTETAAVNGAPTTRNVSPNNVFIGTFTGNLTGAYGVGVEATDLTNLDKIRDLTDTQQTPPNNVTATYNAVAIGDILFAAQTWEDNLTVSGSYSIGDTAITLSGSIDTDMPQPGRIDINGTEYNYASYSAAVVTLTPTGLIESLSGGENADLIAFRKNQYTSNGNTNTQAYIEVTEAIETFDKTAGFIRIWNDVNLVWDRYRYDSYDVATKRYTLNTTDHPTGLDQNYTDTDPIFVPLMDEVADATPETSNHIHTTDVVCRFRLYKAADPIVPFEVAFTVGANGVGVQAIRNPDA